MNDTKRSRAFRAMCGILIVLSAASVKAAAQRDCDCPPDSSAQLIEPNWGELRMGGYLDPPNDPEPLPDPKYVVVSFAVSPDGRWLAYRAGWRKLGGSLLLKDLRTGELRVIAQYGTDPQWHPNGSLLMYRDDSRRGLEFYDVERSVDLGGVIVGYCDTSVIVTASHISIGSDGELYFQNGRDESHGSIGGFYRILLDSSFRAGCIVRERIAGGNWPRVFPPHTMEWYLGGMNYWEIPGWTFEQADQRRGFSIVHKFDWEGQRAIHGFDATVFPGIDTSIVEFNREGWWSPSFGFYESTIGPCGELYMHFGFAHRQEIVIDTVLPGYGPVFHRDTATFRARERSGWYRLDTAAGSFAQLARVWTPLGISYATHVDRIYYGLHTPDSMMSIWEMDRCGRNKRQVTFPEEDPFTALLDVEEAEAVERTGGLELWPVPARDGVVRLRFVAPKAGRYMVHVRDVLGRSIGTVRQFEIGAGGLYTTELATAGLAPGPYFVAVLTPDGRALRSATLIVER